MLQRIGIFFLFVGILLIIFSVLSGKLDSDSITFFCAGLPLALLGVTLWLRNRETAQVQRFRLLRRSAGKEAEKETQAK
jgi:hypothetical protein